jgi:hypothetical protein
LPRLEEVLDFGNEGRKLGLKRRVPVGGFEVVQELLAHEVGQGLLRAELVLDGLRRLALLDPHFAEVHGVPFPPVMAVATCGHFTGRGRCQPARPPQ